MGVTTTDMAHDMGMASNDGCDLYGMAVASLPPIIH